VEERRRRAGRDAEEKGGAESFDPFFQSPGGLRQAFEGAKTTEWGGAVGVSGLPGAEGGVGRKAASRERRIEGRRLFLSSSTERGTSVGLWAGRDVFRKASGETFFEAGKRGRRGTNCFPAPLRPSS